MITHIKNLLLLNINLKTFGISILILLCIAIPTIYFLSLHVFEYCDVTFCPVISVYYSLFSIPFCIVIAHLLSSGNWLKKSILGVILLCILLLSMYLFRDSLINLTRNCGNSTTQTYFSPSKRYQICWITTSNDISFSLKDTKSNKQTFTRTKLTSNTQDPIVEGWSNDENTVYFTLDDPGQLGFYTNPIVAATGLYKLNLINKEISKISQ